MKIPTDESGATYLSGPKVRDRYGVSDMTIWRWLNNPELGFPKPRYFGRNRFFRLDELVAWEQRQPTGRRRDDSEAA